MFRERYIDYGPKKTFRVQLLEGGLYLDDSLKVELHDANEILEECAPCDNIESLYVVISDELERIDQNHFNSLFDTVVSKFPNLSSLHLGHFYLHDIKTFPQSFIALFSYIRKLILTNVDFSPIETLPRFCEILLSSNRLKSLRFVEPSEYSVAHGVFGDYLSKTTTLKELAIAFRNNDKDPFVNKHFLSFCDGFKQNRSLRTFDVECYFLPKDEYNLLMEAISPTYIEEIILTTLTDQFFLTPQARIANVYSISSFLQKCPNLHRCAIELNQNSVRPDTFKSLIEDVKYSNIEELLVTIPATSWWEIDIPQAICEFLLSSPPIVQIVYRTRDDCTEFCKCLKSCKLLQRLSLKGGNISHEDLDNLLSSLHQLEYVILETENHANLQLIEKYPTIREIKLSFGDLTQEIACVISESLKRNTSLRILKIDCHWMYRKPVTTLWSSLETNLGLNKFWLLWNGYKHDNELEMQYDTWNGILGQELAGFLEKNMTLQEVDVRSSRIHEAIEPILKRNRIMGVPKFFGSNKNTRNLLSFSKISNVSILFQ